MKKMLENNKVVNKLRKKLNNQQLQMDNLSEIIKQYCISLKIYRTRKVFRGLLMRWRHEFNLKVFPPNFKSNIIDKTL